MFTRTPDMVKIELKLTTLQSEVYYSVIFSVKQYFWPLCDNYTAILHSNNYMCYCYSIQSMNTKFQMTSNSVSYQSLNCIWFYSFVKFNLCLKLHRNKCDYSIRYSLALCHYIYKLVFKFKLGFSKEVSEIYGACGQCIIKSNWGFRERWWIMLLQWQPLQFCLQHKLNPSKKVLNTLN